MNDDTAQLAPPRPADPRAPEPGTVPGPRRARALPAEEAPVFVDASGRRRRRVQRIGRLLAIPAAGYLLLLASNLLGGPAVDAPFLPQPPERTTPAPQAPQPTAAAEAAAADAAAADPTSSAPATRRATAPPAPTAAAPTTDPATAAPTPSASRGKPTAPNPHKPTKSP
ncbi:hypothetical protein ACGFX4_32275 [Kitasatospora sp. NPDC048365]|uniref:hypothetical protein n=1 Tax=Kitasatospora sp. NPDC048365 TaxID=3364050 RepID=UPI003719C2E2